MRLRFVLPAVLLGAGLLLPVQMPAAAKSTYKIQKVKKYKAHKFKGSKHKGHKVTRHKTAKHRQLT